MMNKTRKITFALIVCLLAIVITLTCLFTACASNNGNNGGNDDDDAPVKIPYYSVGQVTENPYDDEEIFNNNNYTYDAELKLQSSAIVGYSGKVVGTVTRDIPTETLNQGLPAYPKYGSTLREVIGSGAEQVAARNALIAESSYLTAAGTANAGGGGYTWMDKDGFLYSGTVNDPVKTLDKAGDHRRLYKHSASVGLYLGDVSDEEPAIIKEVTMRPRGYNGYGVTGVYAPAGEVVKIQISEADMNATGGITIHIGQALYNGQANNIWSAKNQMQRIPHLLNTMTVNKNTATLENGIYTAYVGSFIGGPLYIRNTNVTFKATISGGVAYSHFILGYTTKEEFEKNKQSSAPYFDLEVWDRGVLHSGPKYYANNFSYEDIYKAAVLWDKVATVTTYSSYQGVVFLYDPFVAAGAAVAFPGRRSVNCPMSWMPNSLNYNAIVTSGSWGNFHEYHHNFQGYGVGNGGEVTNNGLTLVSYALFTKISANRGIGSFGAQGLGGWNSYTSATYALEETLKIARPDVSPSNGNQGLALYATLLHNFGPDAYIKARATQTGGQNYQAYMNAWEEVTHNNMYYYFKDVLKGNVTENANESYPMFIPVSSVYQTGRSYMYDGEKKYITTMQPYIISADRDFTLDLRQYVAPGGQYAEGSIVIPEGFSYTIKNISDPENGTITSTDVDKVYTYTPGKGNKRSGKIIVTLGITKDDGAFTVGDVDLVIELAPSHESDKMVLERTTYTYSEETMYADAEEAFDNDFAGYSSVVEKADHSNPTQNCNTDIWFFPQSDRDKYPNAPESYFIHDNTIEVLDGKLYFQEEGKYRIYLRGRTNCAQYYSVDGGKTYTLGATVKQLYSDSANFHPNDASTYFDVEFNDTDNWVYIKEVLIVQSSPARSYIGVGMKQWTEPMFTIVTKYYDASGKEVEEGSEGIVREETHYYDYNGREVTEEQANNAELIAPTSASYVNAYRTNYEFPDNTGFESDYFYVRSYNYTYSQTYDNLSQSNVGDNPCPSNFPIENLFDNDPKTACSSTAVVSASAPWEFTVDLGEVIEANRFELTGYMYNNNTDKNQTPKSITLWVGETLDDMKEVANFDNGTVNGISLAFNFEKSTFRYYRLQVRRTVEGRFAAIGQITFKNSMSGRNVALDDEMFTFSSNWTEKPAQSTFGHNYVGKAGDKVSFEFTGTRLGILSEIGDSENYVVTIDGKTVNSINLNNITGTYGVSYMSTLLENGRHTVEIRCNGEVNLDSVILIP